MHIVDSILPAQGRLESVQVGRPRSLDYQGTKWRSGIYKASIDGPTALKTTNLAGDKQANLRFHGGPDKAVCCFPSEHYPFWRRRLGLGEAFAYGAFGENFTFSHLKEPDVCIGDIFMVCSCKVQVTQPRQPCINLVRKWDCPTMPSEMIANGHTGWYLRVLQTGEVEAGQELTLIARPNPEFTIAFMNDAAYERTGGIEAAARIIALPEISEEWRRLFRKRLPVSLR